jgi:predicted nuclease with RNAse H fold
MNQKMIRAYLRQVQVYHSDSKGEMVPVAEMHPRHAANAAQKMLMQADEWVRDAGAGQHAQRFSDLWLIGQPLFQALVERAGY